MAEIKEQHPAARLAYHRQNAWDHMSDSEKGAAAAFCEEYKKFPYCSRATKSIPSTAVRQ
jgi:hypothetical protein